MPYVTNDRRLIDTKTVAEFLPPKPVAGDLNFFLTIVIQSYVEAKGLSYSTINDVVGAMEGAKAEFQRRVVAPYEDGAIARNGDLY